MQDEELINGRRQQSCREAWPRASATAEHDLAPRRGQLRGDAPRDSLERIARLARRYLGVSIGIVDTERVWSKSSHGLKIQKIARERHRNGAVHAPVRPFVIEDAAVEPGLAATIAAGAARLRFYAGVPLTARDGLALGTLCLMDPRPRRVTDEEMVDLVELAAIAGDQLEQRLRPGRFQIADPEPTLDQSPDQLRALQDASLHALTLALEAHDVPTSDHSLAVVGLARAVAAALGLSEDEVTEVAQVALLHDVGKVGIRDDILQKRSSLDHGEWTEMRQHPVIGERIVGALRELEHLAPAVRAAHERWAGGGYPDGLRGEAIPLASRIVFACDSYDAMTTDRSYHRAWTTSHARAELRDNAGTQFDPQVVDRLVAILET